MSSKIFRSTRMFRTAVVALALVLGAAYLPSGTLSAGWVYIGETPNLATALNSENCILRLPAL